MPAYYQAGALDYNKHGISWHGEEFEYQSRSLNGSDTVTSAMKLAGFYDLEIGRSQAKVTIDGVDYPLPKETLYMSGAKWANNETKVIVFDRNVKNYVPVQNHQFAEILDPLTEKMDVAGVMHVGKVGEILAIQLEMPSFALFDKPEEEHRTYLLVSEDRATGKKYHGITVTRVVCSNTHKVASEKMVSLPNLGQPEMVLKYRTGLHQNAVSLQTGYKDKLEKLARTPISQEKMAEVINACYPLPKRGGVLRLYDDITEFDTDDPATLYVIAKGKRAETLYDNTIDRVERHRKNIYLAFAQFNDEHPYAAQTAYALWNAITYNANHGDAYRDNAEARAYNIYFDGTRHKLMEVAWQLIGNTG